MDTLETLLQLASIVEKQISYDKTSDQLEKSIRAVAKNEVLIEIYKLINNEK
jgi:hypothetical protein